MFWDIALADLPAWEAVKFTLQVDFICPFVIIDPRAEVRSSFITTTVWSHHKGSTGRVRTGDQLLPVLCHCQLGQDIPTYLCATIVVAQASCLTIFNLSPRQKPAILPIVKRASVCVCVYALCMTVSWMVLALNI